MKYVYNDYYYTYENYFDYYQPDYFSDYWAIDRNYEFYYDYYTQPEESESEDDEVITTNNYDWFKSYDTYTYYDYGKE